MDMGLQGLRGEDGNGKCQGKGKVDGLAAFRPILLVLSDRQL